MYIRFVCLWRASASSCAVPSKRDRYIWNRCTRTFVMNGKIRTNAAARSAEYLRRRSQGVRLLYRDGWSLCLKPLCKLVMHVCCPYVQARETHLPSVSASVWSPSALNAEAYEGRIICGKWRPRTLLIFLDPCLVPASPLGKFTGDSCLGG